ncbi:Serine/threonine-protein kinase PknB [Planctomycetes bacterium Pan216]|uniref:Serine/threonine-protein kinase PknB n=1 Tax=Kolteria novifilia TaxID=2527975 RepID=A0A518B8G2_9BACT|nr:Serine/threonine-protein kinase PknB [Planctomycetes bacterium Pan216]
MDAPRVTKDEFLATLEKSNLVPPDQIQKVRKLSSESTMGEGLADVLVERQLLTRWQAQELLKGNTAFTFERYRYLSCLGSGSMGTVYLARDLVRKRQVALKLLSPRLYDNAEAVGRFRREIEIVTSLHHPNIIAAYDGDCVGKRFYLAMEYLDGQDLASWLTEKGPLAIPLACECLRQASIGLQFAHDAGLLHRDIKPANLFVTWSGQTGRPLVKILDLGLSLIMSDSGMERLTQSGQILGTPDYIAPEATRNAKAADERSEIYSLGCTFFELLTGKPPFQGKNMLETMLKRLQEDAPALRTVRADAPPELEAIVNQMLQRDPEERYQRPDDVASAISPFCPQR